MATAYPTRIALSLALGWCITSIGSASPDTLWRPREPQSVEPTVLDELVGVLESVARDVKSDEATAAWVRARLREMFALDLYRVYASMPGPDGFRRFVGAVAEPLPDGLQVQRALSPIGASSHPMGKSTVELALTPRDRIPGMGQPYSVEERFGLAMGSLSPGEVLGLVGRVIGELETEEGEGVVRRTLPRASRRAETALRVDLHRTEGGEGIRTLVVRGSLDPTRLRDAGYSDLALTVSRWAGLGTFTAEVRDPHGHRLVSIGMYTDPATLRIEWSSEDGQLVPTNGAGEFVEEERWDLAQGQMEGAIHAHLDARYEGFHLDVSRWEMPLTWRADAGFWSLGVRVTTPPEIAFTAEGALRQAILEMADSTLGLTRHGQSLADTIAQGTHGDGTRFSIGMDRAPPSGWWLEQHMETELLDNAVVRFGFRLVGGRLIPTEAGFRDAGRLVGAVMKEVAADYRAAHGPRINAEP